MKITKWLMSSLSFFLILEFVNCMDPVVSLGVISAIVTIGDTVKKYTIDGDDGMLKSIEELKKTTKLTQETVNRITNQMSSLNTQLTGSTLQIMNELKFKVIQDQIRYIDNAINRLVSTAPSTSSSPEVIRSFFNTFIEQFQAANPDYLLMHSLDSDLPGSKSFIDSFIEKARHLERSNTATMRTSSNKLVFELFSVLGLYIGKAYSIMNLCISIRKYYSLPTMDYNDKTYLTSRLSIQTDKFMNQMRNALKAVDNYDDYMSYMELNPQKAKTNQVRMKMVLQNYLQYEPWLSKDNNTCTGECEDYKERDINGGDGCYGQLRYCKFKVPDYKMGYTAPASDPTSQIYNGYGIWPDWNGHGSFDDTFRNSDRSYSRGFINVHENGRKLSTAKHWAMCHNCLCTCDNFNSPHTVRKFYSGKMEPQIPGYVITGVRFIEKNHVIFLQIQIGKLLPLAMIDPETIHWQKVPDNVGMDYIKFGYDYRKFSLDGVSLDSKIMTGVKFVDKGGSVSIQIFGQVLNDFEMGMLDTSIATVYGYDDVSKDWVHLLIIFLSAKSIEGKIVGLRDNFMDFTKTTKKTIQFGVSDEKTDAGQSFVPYFDGTNIEFDKPAPLSGLGFLHYTNDDSYAGYIRPYIMSLKYKNVLN